MKLCSPQYPFYISLITFLWLGTASASHASGKVTLVATLGNQPALWPAFWNIFEVGDTTTPIKSLPRHSGTLELPAGKYMAILNFDQKTKEKLFRVETDRDVTVIVSMD